MEILLIMNGRHHLQNGRFLGLRPTVKAINFRSLNRLKIRSEKRQTRFQKDHFVFRQSGDKKNLT